MEAGLYSKFGKYL